MELTEPTPEEAIEAIEWGKSMLAASPSTAFWKLSNANMHVFLDLAREAMRSREREPIAWRVESQREVHPYVESKDAALHLVRQLRSMNVEARRNHRSSPRPYRDWRTPRGAGAVSRQVYVLVSGWDYGPRDPVGVFDTVEAAKQYAEAEQGGPLAWEGVPPDIWAQTSNSASVEIAPAPLNPEPLPRNAAVRGTMNERIPTEDTADE